LRQGCPLSPYLFVIAINELSIQLQEALHNNNLSGISLGEGAPPIHSLLFAGDLILCGNAIVEEAQAIKTILYDFCQQSGQTPNLQKSSILFSKNVPGNIKNQIKGIFPVSNLQPNTMHLGHPIIFSHRDKNKAYNFIYNKFLAKFGTLKANKLNHAGRLQYIKSVLSSIPVYYMSTVLFSKTFIEKINTIIRRFWWAGVQEDQHTNPIAFRSWHDICKPTKQGGLGIRDMELINKSLIINSAWNVAINKNPFLSAILKAKYYPNNTFWTAPATCPRSVYWSSIFQVKHYLHSNASLQIHAGNSSIWSSPWTNIWSNIHDHLLLPVTNSPMPETISDLWMQGTKQWDHRLLSTTFSTHAVQVIESTPVVHSDQQDILRWTPSTNGQCTSKTVYAQLAQLAQHNLPTHGSRSITQDANSILQKVWKGKSIPPFLKTFAWRLIRRALATGERSARYSTHIDKHCTACGAIETDVHLLFLCDLPRQVWGISDPPLTIHLLTTEEDGVQLSLPILLTPDPTEATLSKNLFLMWYIWKARNDKRFQRKNWTSFQVHKAAKAHLETHLTAWEH
jgi:hypothetical protein